MFLCNGLSSTNLDSGQESMGRGSVPGFLVRNHLWFAEPLKNAGRTDDEMRQIRFNYWIITTAIKLSIAAFAFRMLYLQRKRVRIP